MLQGYDNLSRPYTETVKIDGYTKTITTTYDAYQRPYATQYPDGEVVKVNYNSLGLPKLMCPANWNSGAGAYYCIRSEANKSQSPDAWYVSDAGYDVAGRLTRMQYPAGGNLWRTQSYYSWRDPQNPTAVYPNGGLLNEIKVGTDWSHSTNSKNRFHRQYTYNSFGDVLTDGSGYTFGYDSLGRLTSAYGKSYSYWATNRINTFEGRSFGYTNNQPYHAVKSDNSGYSYLYDANGNLTSVEVSGITSLDTYTWDAENRLQSATKNGVTESYAYDVDGNRIKKVSGSVTTRTFFPGLYEEENGVAIKHYSFNGMTIAVRKGTTVNYVHADHLGSSSVETNSSGGESASRTYFAYGSTRSSSGTLTTDRTFTGQKQDGTGLLYYNARYYDNSLGTFLSPDTLVPDAGRVVDYNRFLYVRGNPLSLNDPTGHCATTTSGEPDMDGDTECWQLAYSIAGLGYTEQGFWEDWGGQDRSEWWLNNIANQSFATVEYLTPFYERYQSEFEGRTGLRRPVSLEPVVNPELHQPGEELILTVGRDVYACTHSVTDCGNALDDLSTTLSGVAMGCLVAGFVPCAGVAEVSGDVVDLIGVGLTAYNIANGQDSPPDLAVSVGGVWISWKYGDIGYGAVGFGISLLQWIYGHSE